MLCNVIYSLRDKLYTLYDDFLVVIKDSVYCESDGLFSMIKWIQ